VDNRDEDEDCFEDKERLLNALGKAPAKKKDEGDERGFKRPLRDPCATTNSEKGLTNIIAFHLILVVYTF